MMIIILIIIIVAITVTAKDYRWSSITIDSLSLYIYTSYSSH